MSPLLPSPLILVALISALLSNLGAAEDSVAPAERDPKTLYVSPQGSDDADGTNRQQALRTIESALKQVHGGDTIILLPGTFYADTIRIANIPGSSDERRLTIRAEKPGLTTISAAWPAAGRGTVAWKDEGDGIFSAPEPARREYGGKPMTTVMGGFKENLMLRWSTLAELREGTCFFNVTRSGKPKGSTFKTPGYGFAIEDGRFYVRLPDRSNPNGQRIVAGTSVPGGVHRSPSDDALVIIDNTPGLVLDGLRFEGAYVALGFQASSPKAVVRNCTFDWCHIGINLPSHSVAEWNEFSYGGLRKLMNECRELNDSFTGGNIFSFGYTPVWMFGSFMNNSGKASNVDVRFNYIHEAWDGIWFGGFRASHCHRNILEDCIDNAIELDQAYGPDLHFHHNLILGAPNGVISQQRPDANLLGPHYIYRNVIVGHDDPGWDSWTLLKLRSQGRSKGFIYHHNLFWVRSSSLYWRTTGKAEWMAATKTVDFRNNVLIAEKMSLPDGVPFASDHNAIAGASGELKELQGAGGLYVSAIENLGFRNPKAYDFTLTENSPLINAGQATPASISNRDIQATVSDGKPDIGPIEFGQIMGTDWPRPRRSAFNAAALGEEPLPVPFTKPAWK